MVEAPAATIEHELGCGAIVVELDSEIVDRPRLADALEPNDLRLAHEASLCRSRVAGAGLNAVHSQRRAARVEEPDPLQAFQGEATC